MGEHTEIEYLDILVRCPGDPSRIEKMQIRFGVSEEGKVPAPCNGCDSVNGTKPCVECAAAITAMFFRDPDMDVSKPITPVIR